MIWLNIFKFKFKSTSIEMRPFLRSQTCVFCQRSRFRRIEKNMGSIPMYLYSTIQYSLTTNTRWDYFNFSLFTKDNYYSFKTSEGSSYLYCAMHADCKGMPDSNPGLHSDGSSNTTIRDLYFLDLINIFLYLT